MSQVIENLKDDVSAETLIRLLPFVEEPDKEIEKVEEQRSKVLLQQQNLFKNQYNNTPPESEEGDLIGE